MSAARTDYVLPGQQRNLFFPPPEAKLLLPSSTDGPVPRRLADETVPDSYE